MTINSILGLVLLISLYQINLSKMKTAIIIPIILIHFSCYSQTTKEKNILDDVGIMVENFEKSNQIFFHHILNDLKLLQVISTLHL